jgi:hypothetical protein
VCRSSAGELEHIQSKRADYLLHRFQRDGSPRGTRGILSLAPFPRWRGLNPNEPAFGEDLNEILRYAFTREAGDGLRRFALVTCVPSVVVPWVGESWIPGLRDALVKSRAIQEADWGRERYLLTKYGSQLFPRAGEETREGYEHIKADESYFDEVGQQMLNLTFLKHEC